MADVTELRCWPACLDAIDWSPEGIIALASDERVELLFPNTVAFDRDQDGAQWEHVPLQVPWFSYEELPVKEPAPLRYYSIGEEVSASAPMALAWSLSGLAKHRRCALAVLTGNLVLSIWAADGKVQERSSWGRRLILNDALTIYFTSKSIQDPSYITTDLEDQIRLRTRVRAFTWAPQFPANPTTHTMGTCLSYGPNIVALCNDDNQLILVEVHSPTSTYGANQSWHAEVLTYVSLKLDHEDKLSVPTLFTELMDQQCKISHVAWSPWVVCGQSRRSVIAYAINKGVRARLVTFTNNDIGLGEELLFSESEIRFSGPMRWAPTLHEHKLTLALFTTTGLVCLTVSPEDASIINTFTHDLDGRWDPTSAAVWDTARGSTPRLHFSSLLSTIINPTCVLEKSADGLQSHDSPSWRDQIEDSAVLFSAKNDLKGNSKVKVWGLATSPLGDFMVSCTSVHPSDMIEYGSPSDRRGTVAVSAIQQYRQLRQSFPRIDVSAEGVLFTLKKLVENTIEDTNELSFLSEEMVTKLLDSYGPVDGIQVSEELTSELSTETGSLELIARLKRCAYFDRHTLKNRYTILVSYACDSTDENELAKALIAYRLSKALDSLPKSLLHSAFSVEIMTHHRQMISLIGALASAPRQDTDSQEQENTAESTTTDPEQSDSSAVNMDFATTTTDTCEFCSAAIPFTDVNTAVCLNGHQFPRCGLSLLAIQAPGITKYCGICNTPYLSEEFVALQETEEHATATGVNENGASTTDEQIQDVGNTASEKVKPPLTLARLLFLACDVCIYCGGKYVG